ncbi:MAG: pyridoxal phosphate-dependent aminotransferase [Spirochaetales bacterium]|nr:pyridoxal phosphate-dependent aminotransferase [Spirochaetales bacterium]
MRYNLDQVIDRKDTNSLKWEFMGHLAPGCPEGTLPLWVADMDFPCPKSVIEALHARVDRRIFGYSSHRNEAFMAAVTGWYLRRFGWSIPPEDLLYSPGIVPAVGYLLEILTRPGDGVIIQSPVYYPFESMIRHHGRETVANPLKDDDGYYTMDFDGLERKAAEPETKLLVLCSPHNPVGRVWKEEELRRLGEICFAHGVTVISDEIHCDLVRRGVKHIPLKTLFPEQSRRIITCTAPSKTFNMAGMLFSNVIIHDPDLKTAWDGLVNKQLGLFMPHSLSIVAVEAAYNEGEEWLEQIIDYLDGNLAFLGNFLQKHLKRARYRLPEGTYLAWIDLRSYGNEEEILPRLIREGRVLVEGGSIFGAGGKGYIRLNAACPRSILEEALRRMAGVLEG